MPAGGRDYTVKAVMHASEILRAFPRARRNAAPLRRHGTHRPGEGHVLPPDPHAAALRLPRARQRDGGVGFAPFVVAPRRIGRERVAVVLPTLTWQAYNFRDDDGNGTPDA